MTEATFSELAVGSSAPDFRLEDASGESHALSDYRGKNVVVYFYPKAATPGCTTEACDFRDSLQGFKGQGYEVLGISPDSKEDISSFAEDFNLNFPLLSDSDSAVARAYGAWGEREINGEKKIGLLRSTVVVDPEGKVRIAQYQVAADGHVAALKDELGL